MDIIQSLALIALLSMLVYLVIVNVFKDKAVKAPGTVAEFVPVMPSTQGPAPVPLPVPVSLPVPVHEPEKREAMVTNQLPPLPHPQTSSIFNPNATGILPQNQDIFDKQADFGSDVTNINQFYKNNPEVFNKILGPNQVTNVSDWEQKSKELSNSAMQASSGPIQAANFEDLPWGKL
jgi:hypothetical protein